MAHEVVPNACERTPDAIRAALERRPDWLQAFEQDWLSAAADFDQGALDGVLDKWLPFACACATPGYLDQVEQAVKRMTEGDAQELVFWGEEGRPFRCRRQPPGYGQVGVSAYTIRYVDRATW
ncbi:DUF6247 family protein [Streptomyces bluensis]|uniref:DUF6247 family protein n=1 Tax=Streptomyces bluensis TaxID=33897 RepID=UPI00167749DE|nr:DUF6247 family protein [Streptomyces bluensis]GGZ66402.1 hypothetical protein GCM10010344_36210 [Streptomyces bluensis]